MDTTLIRPGRFDHRVLFPNPDVKGMRQIMLKILQADRGLCWRLAIVALPAMFLLIIPGVIYGNILAKKEEKIQEAYTVSGGIAEQAFSLIKTVHYYVGEKKMVSRFSDALIPTLALGIKQGLLKGMVLGSIGILFSIFAFMSWYGSILVIKKGIKGSSLYPDYYDTNTVKVNYCTLVYAAFMLLVIWV